MSTQVMSVLPHTPVLTVIDILLTNNFNGIPVVDKNNIIVGIITKYDLIVRRGSIFDDMEAKDVMNNDPLVLKDDLNIEDAVKAFSEHHRVDPIPIVDNNNKVIGIISSVLAHK
jgi:CBS domain-containing protein